MHADNHDAPQDAFSVGGCDFATSVPVPEGLKNFVDKIEANAS